MSSQVIMQLVIRQIENSCVFDLFEKDRLQVTATIAYNAPVTTKYKNWQQAYENHYQVKTRSTLGGMSGGGTSQSHDSHHDLQAAEHLFLDEFQGWLATEALHSIRECVRSRIHSIDKSQEIEQGVDILLAFDTSPPAEPHRSDKFELARLPWEQWSFASDQVRHAVRISRSCQFGKVICAPATRKLQRHKIRILAIFADAPDLDLEVDSKTLNQLSAIAHIERFTCSSTQDDAVLRHQIKQAITDLDGWDVICFFGHSNETERTGGKINLTPNCSVSMIELEPELKKAVRLGLRLAVFASCKGLNIAESLIQCGVGQVVVMREKIRTQAAHHFFMQFCQALEPLNCDVHDCVLHACQSLQPKPSSNPTLEQSAYPSVYLVPSLFRHPQAALFQIEPMGWKRWLLPWLPTPAQVLSIGALSFFSLLSPVNELLTDARYFSQAVYRYITQQVLPPALPPVAVIAIDQESIVRGGIGTDKINPMDRTYLAQLLNKLGAAQVKTIGLDYLLDSPDQDDATLKKAVTAIQQTGTWMVFASNENEAGQKVGPTDKVANLGNTLFGNIVFWNWQIAFPTDLTCTTEDCPFAYQLAVAKTLQRSLPPAQVPQPQKQSRINPFQRDVSEALATMLPSNPTEALIQKPNLPLGMPFIIDFSLPPTRVYRRIAAWELVEEKLNQQTRQDLRNQIVIIAPDGYDRADDNEPVPWAIAYWRETSKRQPTGSADLWVDKAEQNSENLALGSVHAYVAHHLLTGHLIRSVPTWWMIVLSALAGKGSTLIINQKKYWQRWVLIYLGMTLLYGVVSLELYLIGGVLLPWLFPVLAFWSMWRLGQRRTG